nr:flavin reductase family protein [Sulfobacillus harzensis]
MTQAVVPRPIAWVTSCDKEGRVNAAPFSFFTCLASNPPLIGITIMSRQGAPKDTLANARETREFVVNIASEENLEALNRTSIEAPHSFSETAYAGLHLIPAQNVGVPAIADALIHIACRYETEVAFGNQDNQTHPAHLLVGRIVSMEVDDRVMKDGYIDPEQLKAIGRLGGPLFCQTTEVRRLNRPRWPDDAL